MRKDYGEIGARVQMTRGAADCGAAGGDGSWKVKFGNVESG